MGEQLYDELAKSMMLIVVQDDQLDSAVGIIQEAAFTSYPGDGKIFVSPVETAYTIRTGETGL